MFQMLLASVGQLGELLVTFHFLSGLSDSSVLRKDQLVSPPPPPFPLQLTVSLSFLADHD